MKALFALGGGMLTMGLMGKGLFKIARVLRNKSSNFKVGELGKFYKGGFDSKMTKREAILILNVKDNVSKLELKDAHRKILLLNHPDNGGSTYIASKINEAKELLQATAPDRPATRPRH